MVGIDKRKWRGHRPGSPSGQRSPIALVPPVAAPLDDPRRLRALRATELLDAVPSESFDRLTRLAVRTLGATTALVSLIDVDRQVVLSAAVAEGTWGGSRETPLSHSYCQHVVGRGLPLIVEDARVHELLAGNAAIAETGAVAYAGVPLVLPDGHVLGSMCALDGEPRVWSAIEVEVLQDLAATVMTEIELRAATRRLDAEIRTDQLTGVGNRRRWEEEAHREVARARRQKTPLVLALLDLDRFKRYNDRHGNVAGDELLRETAQRWLATLREVDVLIRLGGEEFAILMPNTPLDPAFDVVERLRKMLAGGVTCSAGLAALREGEDHGELLGRADGALFRAKRSGRNASALAS